jgi:hypothetical protein
MGAPGIVPRAGVPPVSAALGEGWSQDISIVASCALTMAVIGSPTAIVAKDDPSIACSCAVGIAALPPGKGPGT